MERREDELWHVAKLCTAVLGPPPPWIVSSVRLIRNADSLFKDSRPEELKVSIQRTLKRPMRARALSDMYLAAAEEYYSTHLADYPSLSALEALGFFSSNEVCALLVLTYLARRLRRASNHELMEPLLARARTHMAVGRLVGELHRDLNPGDALLSCGMRYLAFACMLAAYPDVYEKNRVGLRAGKKIYDPAREEAAYGTTHGFIAASLAQEYGFGVQIANTFISPPRRMPDDNRTLLALAHLGETTALVQQSGSLIDARVINTAQLLSDKRIRDTAARLDSVLSDPYCTKWLLGNRGEIDDETQEDSRMEAGKA